jgi:DNA-binding transcriptional LysR family regulator
MKLRLRQLEAMQAVSLHGSMTRGAQELGISQPAVSRLLADLERSLGFRLFDRRDGRLSPTQEARFILPDVRRVIETMDQIQEVGLHLTERKAGHLRIACLPGFATSHLPSVLTRFLKDRESVTVTLEPDRPERILEWIIGEQYDCGITDGFDGHPAVESEVIAIRTVCIFPEGHRFGSLKRVTPRDLAREDLIHTRRDSTFYRSLKECLNAVDAEPITLIETRQFTAACELVLRGLGVAVVSILDATGYADRGLQMRPFEADITHDLALVRPVHKHPAMVTLEFLEAFRESLTDFRA